jgi:acyl-CoA synthetase (AMP-forming)/AMP-acid ligase II
MEFVKAEEKRIEEFFEENRKKLGGSLTIPNLLRNTLTQHKDSVALIEGETGKRWTYNDFDLESNKLGNALKKLGVKPGDKVAQIHQNHPWFDLGYMAIQKIGAANVPLSPRYVGREVAYILNHSDSVAVFIDEANVPVISEIYDQTQLKNVIVLADKAPEGMMTYKELLEIGAEDSIEESISEDDISSLLYTSGTTGVPKGVMLTHQNCLSQAIMTSEVFEYTSTDIFLNLLPYFHCQYQCFVVPSYLFGMSTLSLRVFDPAKCMEVILRENVTLLLFVPAMHNAYLQIPGFKEQYVDKITSLRKHLYGGSIMPYPTIQKLREWWPGVELQNIFGMTEACGSLTSLTDEHALTKIGAVGQSLSHIDVRIVDNADNTLNYGEAGEIVAWGPAIMKGYYKDPEATSTAMRGGWYHTGDVGKMDEDGFLYIVDRIKDMIVRGGENIYPAELEKVILEHPSVAEVAVIGVPDPRLQEKVKAVVAFKQGQSATEEDLTQHCLKNLAKYKVPQIWEIIPALPRNAMGKVIKDSLRGGHITDVHKM